MNNIKSSQKQEKTTAKKIGGTRNAGSGNQWSRKNDIRNDYYSVELKETKAASYRLTLDDLLKAERNALADRRTMVFGISIQGHNFMVVTENTFLELTDNGTD